MACQHLKYIQSMSSNNNKKSMSEVFLNLINSLLKKANQVLIENKKAAKANVNKKRKKERRRS